MANVNIQELLDNGVHFGHLTRKWNPNMAPYIYTERNGVHIIDLYKTAAKIEETSEALKKIWYRPQIKFSLSIGFRFCSANIFGFRQH